MEVGKRETIYLSLHCHHQNDFCIKIGSDESQITFKLFVEMYVNVVYVMSSLYSAVGLTQVREQHFVRIETPEGGGGEGGTIPNATLSPPQWLLHSNGQACELLHI